jgi:hypothetical protein
MHGTRGTCPLTCAGADEVAFDVLSRLFRRLFLRMLSAAHEANRLKLFGNRQALPIQMRSPLPCAAEGCRMGRVNANEPFRIMLASIA